MREPLSRHIEHLETSPVVWPVDVSPRGARSLPTSQRKPVPYGTAMF